MTETILGELNKGQQEAVTSVEGPLMIIAGAGTGKTRVITSRILHLLLQKKVPATQILALTFTEKAANEMIERVDQAMPLSYEEVAIKTFHGFCDTVLRERGMEIGLDPGYRLLTQAEQWLFLKENLFQFELDYYRPLGNPSKFFFSLLSHFSRLKDEDILPDQYVELAQQKTRTAADDVQKEEAQKMLELANAYAKYQELMVAANALDFGDLQYFALRLIEKRPSVLNALQEQYRYIMVDEFQDTNFAQNKLVMMIAEKYKNIAVVGDDDQSIYKWRGASLSNIRSFQKIFPDAKKVVLTENYRSTQSILDAAYAVIRHNDPYRLEAESGLVKKLTGHRDEDSPVLIWHFLTLRDEVGRVIGRIGELMGSGVPLREMAILTRTNQLAQPFVEALKDAGIPFTIRDTRSLTKFEEIKDLMAFLRFVAQPYDDIAFFRVLTLPVFGLPVRIALSLVSEAKAAGYEPLFKHLRKKAGIDDAQMTLTEPSDANDILRRVYELMNELLEFSRGHTVNRLLGEFLDRSGYFSELMKSGTNDEKIQRIGNFMQLAEEFSGTQEQASAKAFTEYVDMMDEANGTPGSFQQGDQDAVSLLTVHAAKGLEFDYVFVPSLVHQRFPATNRSDPVTIPPELIQEDIPHDDQHLHEERRLFYVACTRAKRELTLSYADTYEGRKKWKPSVFVTEIQEGGNTKLIDFAEAPGVADTPEDSSAVSSGERAHAGIDRTAESAHESPLLAVPDKAISALSYSKIDAFETCPLKYKFRYVFELPSPSAHAANFGSSVHNTVNSFYEEIKKGKEPTLELLRELYDQSWIRAGYDSRAHEQARKKKGWDIMERFFDAEKERGFEPPAHLERPFRLKIGSTALSGRIDRIDRLPDGTYEVIDYKTGKSKRDSNLKKDLQLSLYALACRDVFRLPVSKLTLYFLEDGLKQSTTRTDEDLRKVEEEVEEIYGGMVGSDMKPTPGFHCGFCEFRILCDAAQ